MKAIKNVEYVTNKVTNVAVTLFKFERQSNLESKKIVAIEVHKVGDVPKTPLGNAVLNATAFKNAFLTLKVKGNRDAIHHLPLNALNVPANDGKLKEFDLIDIDFENSYIQFSTAVGLVIDEEVLFSFYYDEK